MVTMVAIVGNYETGLTGHSHFHYVMFVNFEEFFSSLGVCNDTYMDASDNELYRIRFELLTL